VPPEWWINASSLDWTLNGCDVDALREAAVNTQSTQQDQGAVSPDMINDASDVKMADEQECRTAAMFQLVDHTGVRPPSSSGCWG